MLDIDYGSLKTMEYLWKKLYFFKTLKHLTATTCLHVYFVFLGCHSETEKGCYSPDANTKRAHLPIRQVSEWAKLWQQ